MKTRCEIDYNLRSTPRPACSCLRKSQAGRVSKEFVLALKRLFRSISQHASYIDRAAFRKVCRHTVSKEENDSDQV
jgi:hypothetical protein